MTSISISAADLDAARRHDEAAFARLVAPLRAGLLAHCYRMLGSVADAEDAVQDALLRAWRGLPRFEGRSSLRSWLFRIATNVCLRLLERRPPRLLPPEHTAPTGELPWLEPFPDALLGVDPAGPDAKLEQRESIELAFVVAVQHLPPRQRAVLLLRDVLGFAPAEIAGMLDVSPAAVSSALQRAHAAVEQRGPERTQQSTLRALGDTRVRRLVERYVAAWEAADVGALVGLLTEDAVFAMPPRPEFFVGRAAIAAFLPTGPLDRPRHWRHQHVACNGQPALAAREVDGALHALVVLTLEPSGLVSALTAWHGAMDPAQPPDQRR